MRFGFIRRQMKAYPVTVLCKVMRVSRSGFYQYLKRNDQGPERDPAETALKARIQAIFKAHRSKYGARRIMKELNNQGHQIGIYKVRRLMRELGLKAKSPRSIRFIKRVSKFSVLILHLTFNVNLRHFFDFFNN